MTTSRRIAPLPLLLIGLAVLAALVLIPWVVHAQTSNLTSARRLTQGSNIGWTITVTPDSAADVTIVLPVTTDCDDEGAVCTADGRKLSNRLEFTVSGPGQG